MPLIPHTFLPSTSTTILEPGAAASCVLVPTLDQAAASTRTAARRLRAGRAMEDLEASILAVLEMQGMEEG
jgi:hypothetical protein